jgi:hypothetical protein
MSSHSLPRERYILGSGHDFTVVAYDTEREERTNSNGVKIVEHVPKKAHDFAVSRDVLERVPYFRAILAPRGLRDTGKDFHELHEDDAAAWRIWMQILHDTVDTDSYEVGIATVWNVLVIADKYELSPKSEVARRWFASWYKRWGDPETVDDCSEALYPCHTFDHPRGFARATKLLAYENEGHIGEQMPLGGQVYHLRLDNRITRMSLSSLHLPIELTNSAYRAAERRSRPPSHHHLPGAVRSCEKDACCRRCKPMPVQGEGAVGLSQGIGRDECLAQRARGA